jgi:putative tryptophan/tyrosine transport system substrate-binding protein
VRRRTFVAGLGSTVAWSVAARAQQLGKLRIIGFLDVSKGSGWSAYFEAFVAQLRELGWIEGRTVHVERRQAEGRNELYAEIAAEFVRLNVAAIVTGGIAVRAAMQATSTIPIIFAVANDPVGGGLVASLSRPGGNVTGLSLQARDLVSNRLAYLREVIPNLRRLAVMGNATYPSTALEMSEVQATASRLGIVNERVEIRVADDIAPAIGELKDENQAIFICNDALVNANHARINALALAVRLPTIHAETEYVHSGGLMSYAANYPVLFRRAPRIWSTKFCAGPSPAISRSSSPPSSSSSSTSRPRKHLASQSRKRSWPQPTN